MSLENARLSGVQELDQFGPGRAPIVVLDPPVGSGAGVAHRCRRDRRLGATKESVWPRPFTTTTQRRHRRRRTVHQVPKSSDADSIAFSALAGPAAELPIPHQLSCHIRRPGTKPSKPPDCGSKALAGIRCACELVRGPTLPADAGGGMPRRDSSGRHSECARRATLKRPWRRRPMASLGAIALAARRRRGSSPTAASPATASPILRNSGPRGRHALRGHALS